jgi:hypothetical protein
LVAEALNLLVVLAVPRLYARWCAQAQPAELRAALDARVVVLAAFCSSARGSLDAERFREATPKVRALAESVASTPPESLSEPGWAPQARECLEALGFETPPGGWESFEGWSRAPISLRSSGSRYLAAG